jgi:hypothetical protein
LHSQLDKEMFHATCHTIMIQVAEKIALFIWTTQPYLSIMSVKSFH